VTRIQASWLQSDISRAVVAALGADNIKFVGGAVRDTLAGLTVSDIDAATCLLPENTMARLRGAGIKVIPTGLKHGTVTAVLDKDVMEITTLRFDVETDGRHAEVAFTDDWLEDAKRRDFTINALYSAPDGALFDPFGGISDLAAGLVRFIGDASDRIDEDALRILRFFRFYGKYGTGAPDPAAINACSKKADLMQNLSAERVRDELMKMATQPNFRSIVKEMEACGVLVQVYGATFDSLVLEGFLKEEKHSGAQINPLLRFYHLASPSLNATGFAKKFRLSNEDRKFLVGYEKLSTVPKPASEKDLRRAIYSFGAGPVKARAIGFDQEWYNQALTYCDGWPVATFPVRGEDLLSLGEKPGPLMGVKLKAMEALWIESDFALTKEQLLAASH